MRFQDFCSSNRSAQKRKRSDSPDGADLGEDTKHVRDGESEDDAMVE
jgi:hypothetical protein